MTTSTKTLLCALLIVQACTSRGRPMTAERAIAAAGRPSESAPEASRSATPPAQDAAPANPPLGAQACGWGSLPGPNWRQLRELPSPFGYVCVLFGPTSSPDCGGAFPKAVARFQHRRGAQITVYIDPTTSHIGRGNPEPLGHTVRAEGKAWRAEIESDGILKYFWYSDSPCVVEFSSSADERPVEAAGEFERWIQTSLEWQRAP